MRLPSASTVWMCVVGLAGLVLTLKVFAAIMSGEMVLLRWTFKRDDNERVFWIWMTCFALICLVLYFVALKFYLGPFGF